MLVSTELATAAKPRPDLNEDDTVQTVWTEFSQFQLLVGGVYRRCRTGQTDLEQDELDQLSSQILRAASTGLDVIVIGDTNLDHMNPNHRRALEASQFLKYIEAASMRHLPTGPTWQSHGLYNTCKCDHECTCLRLPRTSMIDNAFCSISTKANVRLLQDVIADHTPLELDVAVKTEGKNTILETAWTRELNKVSASEFEALLNDYDWSPIYGMSDPDDATEFLVNNVQKALDTVAPPRLIKFRSDKPPLYLNRDTLRIMSLRDAARNSKNQQHFKALRNKANKLVKRDKVLSVLKRLKKNPGPKQIWQEAKTILGKGKGANKLPDVTTNQNPEDTADTQNKFF